MGLALKTLLDQHDCLPRDLNLPSRYSETLLGGGLDISEQARQAGLDLNPLRLLVADRLARTRPCAFDQMWDKHRSGKPEEDGMPAVMQFIIGTEALRAVGHIDLGSLKRLTDNGLTQVEVPRFFCILRCALWRDWSGTRWTTSTWKPTANGWRRFRR
jgi:hypothetical protein